MFDFASWVSSGIFQGGGGGKTFGGFPGFEVVVGISTPKTTEKGTQSEKSHQTNINYESRGQEPPLPPCGRPCFVSIIRSKFRVIDHVSKQNFFWTFCCLPQIAL